MYRINNRLCCNIYFNRERYKESEGIFSARLRFSIIIKADLSHESFGFTPAFVDLTLFESKTEVAIIVM